MEKPYFWRIIRNSGQMDLNKKIWHRNRKIWPRIFFQMNVKLPSGWQKLEAKIKP